VFKKILVSELITEGARLLEALRRNRFPLTAALWSYFPDATEWRLVLVSPAADRGALKAYTRVQRILKSIGASYLTLTDITLVSPVSQDYKDLRKTVPLRSGPHTELDPIQGMILQDPYVYSVSTPVRQRARA
jgi:hypothetical protein